MYPMNKSDFKHKIILIILEKGFIALVVTLVGFWINSELKNIDHKNDIALQEEIEKREKIINLFNVYRDSINASHITFYIALQNNFKKERDSLNRAFLSIENERIKEYQLQLRREQNTHENNLIRFEKYYQEELQRDMIKLENSLQEDIEKIRSDYQFFNNINTIASSQISEIWNQIYEFDYFAEKFIKSIAKHDNPIEEDIEGRVSGKPTSLFGWTESRIIDDGDIYVEKRNNINELLITKRYWLSDSLVINMKNYISAIDKIVETTDYKNFRFLFPDFSSREVQVNLRELDSLIQIKKNVRKTVFDEAKLIKRFLFNEF